MLPACCAAQRTSCSTRLASTVELPERSAGDTELEEPTSDLSAHPARVLILGAPRGIRPSLATARAAGFHVIAADSRADAEGLSAAHESYVCDIRDADVVTKLAQTVHAQGLVATTDHAVLAIAIAAERLGLPGIGAMAAASATRKSLMRVRWQEQGLPQPRFAVVNDERELRSIIAQLGLPVVLKPANALGGGSRGVSIARDAASLALSLEAARAAAPDGAVIIEECIDARTEHSVELLLHNGTAHVLAIGDKIKTSAPYRVDLAVCYPTGLDADQASAVGTLAEASARALGIFHGMVHVEIGVTPHGLQLFEAGARCGGGATAAPVVPTAYGIDEFVEACRLACGQAPARTRPTQIRGVCYRFIPPRIGRVLLPDTLVAVRALPGVLDVDVWACDPIAGDGVVREGRDRIGALVTVGRTRDDALATSEAALALLDSNDSRNR